MKWVHEYYHVNDQWIPILKTDMTLRDTPAASSSSSVARPTGGPKGAPKKPPYPPSPQKCSSMGAQDTPSVRPVVFVGGTPRIGEIESLNSSMRIAPTKRLTTWVAQRLFPGHIAFSVEISSMKNPKKIGK